MHRATACCRLQSYANNLEFVSLCTGLLALPDGMGALYATLVSSHFGAEYIQNPTSRKQLAECHARNSELTAALIQNREGAQAVLETGDGMPGSIVAELEADIGRRDPSDKYRYVSNVTGLSSHVRDWAVGSHMLKYH